MKKLATIMIILFIVSGCGINHTVKYVKPSPTIVPTTLSIEDVEFVILLALSEVPAKKEIEKRVEIGTENRLLGIAETIVERLFGKNQSRRQHWHYEGQRGENIIYAGFSHRRVYIQVKIEYNENEVTFEIMETRGLQRKKGAIHKNAVVWLGRLEVDIRIALGRYDCLMNENW